MDHAARAVAIVHAFIGGAGTLAGTLTEIASIATEAAGGEMAGLTITTDLGRPKTVVYTDRMVPEIDQAQYNAGRGPCLEAARQCRELMIADVSTDERWPEFSEAALRHSIKSTLSIPLIVGGRSIGALNIYATDPRAFDDEAVATATLITRHAAIIAAYFDRAEEADNLQHAIASRAQIEQAKGVIMATTGCGVEQAFDILRSQSQSENRKLRDVAAQIVVQQRRNSS
jgi:GAF domain-containing protein